MSVVRIDRHPNGPRFYAGPVRIHHWEVGVGLILLGVWLVVDDRSDLPRRRPRPVALLAPAIAPRRGDFGPIGTTTTSDGVW